MFVVFGLHLKETIQDPLDLMISVQWKMLHHSSNGDCLNFSLWFQHRIVQRVTDFSLVVAHYQKKEIPQFESNDNEITNHSP